VKPQRKVTACPRKKAFFDSLNEPLHVTAARLRILLKPERIHLGAAREGGR
jgi:hypothetical protein